MDDNDDYLQCIFDNTIRYQHQRRIQLEEGILDIVSEIPPEDERIERMPIHTSALTGMNWIYELIHGHNSRIHSQLRMPAPIFLRLCKTLKDNYGLSDTLRFFHVEAVAIFLFIIAQGSGFRQAEERFQRSISTINLKFHEVLETLVRFTADEIHANVNAEVHSHVRYNNIYYPHFKNCIGGIDGSHVGVCVPKDKLLPFVSRKGTATQNVLGVCDFDMCFTYVSTGWEGSMHDARILGIILRDVRDYNFPTPPEDKYYLVDSGYPNMKGYLAPYKGDRYHLPDFRTGNSPRNANEIFNRSHASLRSVIERTFGVWKNRWHILYRMPYLKMEDQSKLVAATMALHNFIRRSYRSNENFLEDFRMVERNDQVENGQDENGPSSSSTQMRADSYMDNVRNEIRHSICGIGQ